MSRIVLRTCTEIPEGAARRERSLYSRPLSAYRDTPAYVLLGDPGAGKTTSFETEREALGDDACLVAARDFVTLDPCRHPEWRGKTLFVDGLDEVRAGHGSAREPLDRIRRRLDDLGRPPFRLSCREADWLGTNDRVHLAKMSRNDGVVVLRLDPLTGDDVERILSARAGVGDPESFVGTARERGVAGLLFNPQCLNMLADVVTDGKGWPGSRLQLFEGACRRMLQEQNEEHLAATEGASTSPATPDDLLGLAGCLCAVLLVSGSSGYALDRRSEDEEFPALDRCRHECGFLARQVVATKLFSATGRRRRRPVHRQVAEFLGARYLSSLVQGEGRRGKLRRCGVPARRVLALMTGHDGGVFTELRGLAAWLAALCPAVRGEIIERDPVGVATYGDPGSLSTAEKVGLLRSLADETGAMARWLEQSLLDPARAGFAENGLIAPDLAESVRDVLADARRDDSQQTFVLFILRALAQGTELAGTPATLLDVVHDDSRWPGVRRRALRAYPYRGRRQAGRTASLKALLADLSARGTSDSGDALLGILLAKLYPGGLAASEVWEYLSESDSSDFGEYFYFWRSHLVDESPVEDTAIHLDTLVARRDELQGALESRGLRDLPADLLARGLATHGDHLERGRLYDWLGTGLKVDSGASGVRRVRTWLEQRPAVHRAVLTEGLVRCAALGDEEFADSAVGIVRRLYGARQPEGFGTWCLEQAEAWAARDRRVVHYLLRHACHVAHCGGDASGISLHALGARARANAVLNGVYREIRESDRRVRLEMERHERDHERYREVEGQRHEEWLDWVRASEAALRDGRGDLALLHQLALAYLGRLLGAEGDDPWSRLHSLLRGVEGLEAVALRALREAIRRDDLPDVGAIVRLRDEKQEHLLALPALVSLAEIFRTAPEEVDELNSEQLQSGLAFYYCTGEHESPWYGHVVRTHPTVAAGVLVRVAASALRATTERVTGIHELAFREDHREVAKQACLPLLRAMPARGRAKQAGVLESLLWSALRYADREALKQLVKDKVAQRSMDVVQRGRWLAAGCVAWPDRYLEPLERFIDGHRTRARHVTRFFEVGTQPVWRADQWRGMRIDSQSSDTAQENSVAGSLIEGMGARPLEVIVRAAGRAQSPDACVSRLIGCLAGLRDGEASRALDALASDEALDRWRDELVRARDDQQVLRRDAVRRRVTVEEACRTLDNGPPANAADLTALTADRLDEIAREIRNDDANGWRPFWNEDEHRHPETPKHEESCRDALLMQLRHRLREHDVEVQPEGRYANDKRADLRLSCRDFQVPVEIKKNGHPRLWSALHDQLMSQYTRDPATDGYGIYLVLWFGEGQGRRMPPPASGSRPAGPGALKRRLEEELTPEELRRISICVIDVSAPAGVGR